MAKKYLSIDEIESMGISGPKVQEAPAVKETPKLEEVAKEEEPEIDAAPVVSVAQRKRGRPRKDAQKESAPAVPDLCHVYITPSTRTKLNQIKVVEMGYGRKFQSLGEIVETAVDEYFKNCYPAEYSVLCKK